MREPARILSVSPIPEDHLALERLVDVIPAKARWKVQRSSTLASALATLRASPVAIVICERDLWPGTWIDMLDPIALAFDPPLLIVTSRLADNHLWAEALNRGAYDVIAKPFRTGELARVVNLACRHWVERRRAPARVMAALQAAS